MTKRKDRPACVSPAEASVGRGPSPPFVIYLPPPPRSNEISRSLPLNGAVPLGSPEPPREAACLLRCFVESLKSVGWVILTFADCVKGGGLERGFDKMGGFAGRALWLRRWEAGEDAGGAEEAAELPPSLHLAGRVAAAAAAAFSPALQTDDVTRSAARGC